MPLYTPDNHKFSVSDFTTNQASQRVISIRSADAKDHPEKGQEANIILSGLKEKLEKTYKSSPPSVNPRQYSLHMEFPNEQQVVLAITTTIESFIKNYSPKTIN